MKGMDEKYQNGCPKELTMLSYTTTQSEIRKHETNCYCYDVRLPTTGRHLDGVQKIAMHAYIDWVPKTSSEREQTTHSGDRCHGMRNTKRVEFDVCAPQRDESC